MKKSLIIFVLLSLSGVLFARGNQESSQDPDPILKVEEGQLAIEQTEIKTRSGLLYVSLDKITYGDILYSKGIVSIQDAGGTSYYSADLAEASPSDTEALLQVLTPEMSNTFDSLQNQDSLKGLLLSAAYGTVSLSQSVLSQLEDASQTIQLPVPAGDAVLRVLLSDETGDNGLVLNLTTSVHDLFYQEEAILSELFSGETQEKQRALLLGAYIYSKDGSSEDFSSYTDLFGLDSSTITSLFPASGEERGETLQSGLDRLQTYFALNFKNNYEDDESFTSPYLHFSEADFLSLYEKEGSAYIRDYLEFLFAIGKPLFSSFYTGENNSFENGSYNFRDYVPISQEEGETLAKNALRYLNWGVEYSLPDRVGSIDTASSDRKVFSSLLEEEGNANSSSWLQGSDGDPSVNYLASRDRVKPVEDSTSEETLASVSSRVFEISQLKGDDSISLAGVVEAPGVTVQNLEVWTSRNLLYDPTVRKSVASSSGEDMSGLYDGRTDSSVAFNGREKVITLTFSSPQDIGGIVLRGTFPSGRDIHFALGNSDETGLWRRSSPVNFSWKRIGTPLEAGTDSSRYYYRYLQDHGDLQGVSQLQLTISADQVMDFSLDEVMVFEGDPLCYVNDNENGVFIDSYEHLFAGRDKAFQDVMKKVLYNTTETTVNVSTSRITSFVQGEEVTDYILNLKDSEGTQQFQSNGKVYKAKNPIQESFLDNAFFFDLPLQCIVEEGTSGQDLTLMFQTGSDEVQNMALLDSESILQKSLFLVASYEGESLYSSDWDDTPFLKGGTGMRGNPLPYTPLGVDSPRTFAYKMVGQASSDPLTTLAVEGADGSWENYRNYETGSGKYRPGLVASSDLGYDDDQYSPSQSAGVDSLGFLSGVAAMSGVSLMKKDGSVPTDKLDDFYQDLSSLEAFFKDKEYENLRLAPADLELTTLLVPSADMAREGDILVRYDEKGEIEDLAFIVEMPSSLGNGRASDFWTGVKVVSVKRVFKRASLGVWGLDESIRANGFTHDPSRYQIRRLLAKRDSPSSGEGIVQWEAVDNLPAKLDYTINFDLNPSQGTPETLGNDNLTDFFLEWGEHFVPNTAEPLRLNSLEFTLTDASGQAISYFQETGQRVPIELAPPKDPYYDSTKSDSGNVYNNTGDGIDFGYVYWKEKKPDTPYIQRLATMTKKASGTYTVTKDPDASGELYLEYDTQKDKYILKYAYQEDETSDVTKEFYVSALQESGGASRPGDDFLLNFRLADYPDAATSKEDDDINFLAVYDKKMLWRANLYIAEEKGDWNDLHPWTSGNEWNRVLSEDDYDAFAENKLISTLAVGEGGQVINIPDYTPVRSKLSNVVEGRVAYDYPDEQNGKFMGYDSPFDFTYKLLRQRENINNFYSTGEQPDVISLPSGDSIAVTGLQDWDKTKAPSNQWRNYRRSASGEYEPYLTGLGLYKHAPTHNYLEEGLKGQYNAFINESPSALSAGVDCLGFAKRSASYEDATYSWGKVNGNITEGASSDVRNGNNFPKVGEQSYVISDKNSFYENEETGIPVYDNLEKIIPGDVFYYNDNGSKHISIVLNTTYLENSRNTDYTQITLIESYFNGSDVFVNNSRTLKVVSNGKDKEWSLTRLK